MTTTSSRFLPTPLSRAIIASLLAAIIFAAAIIPLTVVWSLHGERLPKTTTQETTHAAIETPSAPRALDGVADRADQQVVVHLALDQVVLGAGLHRPQQVARRFRGGEQVLRQLQVEHALDAHYQLYARQAVHAEVAFERAIQAHLRRVAPGLAGVAEKIGDDMAQFLTAMASDNSIDPKALQLGNVTVAELVARIAQAYQLDLSGRGME